eukprot:2429094-Pyramimonas_sp.AAC.1
MSQCLLPRASEVQAALDTPRGPRVGVSLGLKGLVGPAKVWQRAVPCGFPLDPPQDLNGVDIPGPDLTCAVWSWDAGSFPSRPLEAAQKWFNSAESYLVVAHRIPQGEVSKYL